VLQKFLDLKEGNKEKVQLIQQLVNALVLPGTSEKEGKEKPYHEEHRSPGAMIQDNLMIHIELLLQDKLYRLEDMEEETYQRLLRLKNRFLIYKRKIYRRETEG